MNTLSIQVVMISFWHCLYTLLFVAFYGAVQAQPATSRGEQRLPISFQEGMNRASAALQAEGYVNIGTQSNMVLGYKGENTALILVNEGTNGYYWINIVVASLTNDTGIPGGERVRLQTRIGQTGGVVGGGLPISGTWMISQGSFIGTLRLSQSGINLSGSMDWENYPDAIVESGSYNNGKVTFVLSHANGVKGTYTADVEPSGRTMVNGITSSGGSSSSWYGTKKE